MDCGRRGCSESDIRRSGRIRMPKIPTATRNEPEAKVERQRRDAPPAYDTANDHDVPTDHGNDAGDQEQGGGTRPTAPTQGASGGPPTDRRETEADAPERYPWGVSFLT